MRTPAFWTRPPGFMAAALWPFSLAYGSVAAARMTRTESARAPVPVVCVGNVVAGGQGKTPVAIAFAAILETTGRKAVFLTRGHGGRLTGPVLVDPTMHSAVDVGDEPLLLARAAPTIVCRDRRVGAVLATAHGADVIIMDDGFQNPSLAKDLSIIVTDAGFGLGNGLVLPAGPLRAPLDGQLARAAGLVVVGNGDCSDTLVERARNRGLTVFRARLEAEPDARAFAGQRLFAFAGIGRPRKFFNTLTALGADVVATRSFPDHHPFSARDVGDLIAAADRYKARLITTEKDFARLEGNSEPLRRVTTVLRVTLVFEKPSAVESFLIDGLQRRI